MSGSTSTTPAERHAALVRELRAHDYRYYVLDDPQVTDAGYDARMRELKALEAEHPELSTDDSPTRRVGGEARTDVVKVKRPQKMFSLDNAYSEEDVAEFLKRVRTGLPDREIPRFVVEPKLDGASIEVVYEGGKLVQASTRGDGETPLCSAFSPPSSLPGPSGRRVPVSPSVGAARSCSPRRPSAAPVQPSTP
jgi:DNA ligase (NAD+)